MTAQRAALRRVKAFCAGSSAAGWTNALGGHMTIADLRAVVALAERAMADDTHLALMTPCARTRTPVRDCSCPTCARKRAALAPPRAGKRRDDDWTDDAVTMGGAYESPKATGRAGAAALARAGKRAKRSRKAGR
jgi:hypothetical protein